MAIIQFIYQPLILTTEGEQPTLPSPADITPEDPGWVDNSNILVGQFAYNTVDDKWFYRGDTVGIHEFQIDAGTNTLSGLNDTDITSPVEGSIIRFNSTSGKWEDADVIDAETLEGESRQSIIDDTESLLNKDHILSNITGAPATVGWYAISRWKTLDTDFETILITQPGGGLNFDYISVQGTVDLVDETKWNVVIQSSSSIYFSKARLSQYSVGGTDYTYLEIYKNIANIETFSVITKKSIYKGETDVDYTYESLAFTDIESNLLRRSVEYNITGTILNRNNILQIDATGNILCTSIQTASTDPKTKLKKYLIGAWDMSVLQTIDIALPVGVTYDKVIDARVMVNNNTGTELTPLVMDGYWFVKDTNELSMVINENGYYDSSNFNGATNRGTVFLTIEV